MSSTRLVLIETRACMPASCRYPYAHCAVLEVFADAPTPTAIDIRRRGVVKIVWRSEPYPRAGRTSASGRQRALEHARSLL